MALKKILCCCGSGLGSSFMVEINVGKALKKFNLTNVEVSHGSVSDAYKGAADLFIVGRDLESFISGMGDMIVLNNIVSLPELESKLENYLKEHDLVKS